MSGMRSTAPFKIVAQTPLGDVTLAEGVLSTREAYRIAREEIKNHGGSVSVISIFDYDGTLIGRLHA